MGERVSSRSDVGCANSLCASAESGCNPRIYSRARASRTGEARASRAEARASHAERRASHAERRASHAEHRASHAE
eukprot:5796830-Pleurochrysis_carterae.AAC.2